MNFYPVLFESFIIALLLLATVFAFGIVWRVEKELDVSYKFLLGAIIAFTCGEILGLFSSDQGSWINFAVMFCKVIFSILLLAGVLKMRNILREMDGEKEIEKK